MMFVIRRLQELVRKKRIPLYVICIGYDVMCDAEHIVGCFCAVSRRKCLESASSVLGGSEFQEA